jgi:hypothetical protein
MAEALKAGYQKTDEWEGLLARSLHRCNPSLEAELGADLKAYLVTRTHWARELEKLLVSQGTDPLMARELALDELLEKAPEDQPRTEKWELEGAQEDAIAACQQALLRHKLERIKASSNPPAKKAKPASKQ